MPMKGDIAARLRASLRYDTVNGDAHERSVCARQMEEAAQEIERLRERGHAERKVIEAVTIARLKILREKSFGRDARMCLLNSAPELAAIFDAADALAALQERGE